MAAGCAGDLEPRDRTTPDPRSPLGVEGKPLVNLPTGLAIADELLVKFAPGIRDDQMGTVLAPTEGTLAFHGPRTGYWVVRFPDLEAMRAGRAVLRQDPWVVEAIPNHVIEGTGPITVPGY